MFDFTITLTVFAVLNFIMLAAINGNLVKIREKLDSMRFDWWR